MSFSTIMYMLNVNSDQRILINQAKAKLLGEHPDVKGLTDGKLICMVLEKYIGGDIKKWKKLLLRGRPRQKSSQH